MSRRKKFSPRTPVILHGGIRAQGSRSINKRPWWGRRWILMLENLRLGARLGRGRNYAISGQVAEITLGSGSVAATVQGGAATPYKVNITFTKLSSKARAEIITSLEKQPATLGKLLVGDFPPLIEPLLLAHKTPLFPQPHNDWQGRCTCPDWARPCKHITAVLLLLGEAIEHEPLLLLELRGLNRNDLIKETSTPPPLSDTTTTTPSALPATPSQFWGDTWTPATDFGPAAGNKFASPLASRLGPLPFWRGTEKFLPMLDEVYERTSNTAPHVWNGDRVATWRPPQPAATEPGFQRRRTRLRIDDTL
ncbi:MAG: hypothetical protein GX230_06940 [Lentisphaerae bacterium]|nr:hypothetical protein [Lentisphaerota bacterium]